MESPSLKTVLRTLLLVGTLLMAVALLLGALVGKFVSCPGPDAYLILLDAGSVHTSVFTYRYSYPETGPMHIEEINSCDVDLVGVSSFTEDLEVAENLAKDPCVVNAVHMIPYESLPKSTVLLGGTAGMRILRLSKPELAKKILENLKAALTAIAHGMNAEVKILGGLQEAQDGWVTVNYLSGNLIAHEHETLQGALDWGGASAQVTTLAGSGDKQNKTLELFGQRFDLRSKSHLCYGQAEAVNRYRASLVYDHFIANGRSLDYSLEVSDPCLPNGTNIETKISNLFSSPCTRYKDTAFMDLLKETDKNVNLVPGGNGSCAKEVAKLFNPKMCNERYIVAEGEVICIDPLSIPPPNNHPYLAFSTYWYLLNAMELTTEKNGPFTIPMDKFKNTTEHYCSLPYTTLEDIMPMANILAKVVCFQANFMQSLLTLAYHFDDQSWNQIHFVKRVGHPPAEVGWSLGHAIIYGNEHTHKPERQACLSLPVFVVLLIGSGVLFLLALVCSYQFRKPKEPGFESLP